MELLNPGYPTGTAAIGLDGTIFSRAKYLGGLSNFGGFAYNSVGTAFNSSNSYTTVSDNTSGAEYADWRLDLMMNGKSEPIMEVATGAGGVPVVGWFMFEVINFMPSAKEQ